MTETTGDRLSDKIVAGALLASLVLGVGLYRVVAPDRTSAVAAPPRPALASGAAVLDEGSDGRSTLGGSGTVAAPGSPASVTVGGARSGLAGGGTGAGAGGPLTGSGGGTDPLEVPDGPAAPGAPYTPPPPAPPCTTDTANDAYDEVARPLSEALGTPLPADNLRVLTQIAAGCSDEAPTTPLLGLALDLARMVPPTGLPPFDLSFLPYVEAPTIPAPIIDALAPLNDQIMEACGVVGLMGVIMAVVPSTAGLPFNGSELARLIVPATTLCAQLEPEYE